MEINAEKARQEFREHIQNSKHTLTDLKISSNLFKTSAQPILSKSQTPCSAPGEIIYFIRTNIVPDFDFEMIPDILDAITSLEYMRKRLIEKVDEALVWNNYLRQHDRRDGAQVVDGAGDRILDSNDVDVLKKLLARAPNQRSTYRGIIDRCICLHFVYLRAKSCPHLCVHLETYFPDFSPIDSPRGTASKRFPGAQHLRDIDDEEMKDYRQTARNCIKFLHDVAALEEDVACTGMNGEPRIDWNDNKELTVLIDQFLREDILYDAEEMEKMIETWLRKFEALVWRLERIFEIELY